MCIWDGDDGLAGYSAVLLTTDAAVLDKCLDALAATVCAADPRTAAQRRANALGVLATGARRLGCRCGRPDCPAGAAAPGHNVVIHIVAEQATVTGAAVSPGHLLDTGVSIPAELIAELAATAKQRPLTHPLDTPPEPGYVPSKALADFVRCRDLTCRAPGCDRPATDCDLDHTIPWADGGPTHASNLKCYCRTHHAAKTFLRR